MQQPTIATKLTGRYRPTDRTVWSGRSETSEDGRPAYWHQAVGSCNLLTEMLPPAAATATRYALLGYACDTGVRRNQGRPGAVDGPDAIRRLLGPTAYHLPPAASVIDAGSILCPDDDLERSQSALSAAVTYLLEGGYRPLLLGGGHDIAYAHYRGLSAYLGSRRLGILNLDAHFDLRQPPERGNSGTPFWQIATENAAQGVAFDYFCLGVQRPANIPSLFATADRLGVDYLLADGLLPERWPQIAQRLSDWCAGLDAVYLTIDLDGFSSAYAPGVSAPSPLGFTPTLALRIIERLAATGKLISLDVAELNPHYDQDNATARLAARLLEHAAYYLAVSK